MPNTEKALSEVWVVQTRDGGEANLWIVGAESEDEARDMVARNIGTTIVAVRSIRNPNHIALGELRLAPVGWTHDGRQSG